MNYPNSGVLWTTKEQRGERGPNMYGDINVEIDYINELIDKSTDGTITIKLDGWRKTDKNSKPMVSLKVNTYKKEGQQDQPKESEKDPWDET